MTIPILQGFVRIRGNNIYKVINILPDIDNVYNIWSSPFFISLPEDYAIDLCIQWVIFYHNLNLYKLYSFLLLNNINTAEDIFSRHHKSILSEMRSNLENVDSEAEIFSKS